MPFKSADLIYNVWPFPFPFSLRVRSNTLFEVTELHQQQTWRQVIIWYPNSSMLQVEEKVRRKRDMLELTAPFEIILPLLPTHEKIQHVTSESNDCYMIPTGFRRFPNKLSQKQYSIKYNQLRILVTSQLNLDIRCSFFLCIKNI